MDLIDNEEKNNVIDSFNNIKFKFYSAFDMRILLAEIFFGVCLSIVPPIISNLNNNNLIEFYMGKGKEFFIVYTIAITFITLALTIWKQTPKTTQEWLNDFKSYLVLQQDDSEQKIQKNITITEGEDAVALYSHLIEIKTQNDEKVAHLSVKEEFPTLETTEFDTYDEYFFIVDTMYMQRIAAGETNGTSFGSTWEVFWEVVTENLGSKNYDFSENNFADLVLTHNEHMHNMTATISDSNKYKFLAGAEGLADMSGINVTMMFNDETGYYDLKIGYTYQDKQSVEIKISKSEPTDIEIMDFVQR